MLNEKIRNFLTELWWCLNNSSSYESFKEKIISFKLYDDIYDFIYQKNFELYISNSKGIRDKKIKRYFSENAIEISK